MYNGTCYATNDYKTLKGRKTILHDYSDNLETKTHDPNLGKRKPVNVELDYMNSWHLQSNKLGNKINLKADTGYYFDFKDFPALIRRIENNRTGHHCKINFYKDNHFFRPKSFHYNCNLDRIGFTEGNIYLI